MPEPNNPITPVVATPVPPVPHAAPVEPPVAPSKVPIKDVPEVIVEPDRIENGRGIPGGYYLDIVNNEVVPNGKYIHPLTKLLTDVPEGSTYDRHRGHLVDKEGYPIAS